MPTPAPFPLGFSYIPPGAPLLKRDFAYQMIEFGRQIRDDLMFRYPILPGAYMTYQSMASGREWRVSGSERGVPRAIEYLNNSSSINYNGIFEYGMEQFVKRRVADYLAIGRTMFAWDEGKEQSLRYLDPVTVRFNIGERHWYDSVTMEKFAANRVQVHHPVPIGGSGLFVSYMWPLLPSAMLSWLISEHDRAAADGRKARDIYVVLGEDLAEQIKTSIEDLIAVWSGADVTKVGINVVSTEVDSATTNASNLVTRLGIANIPEGFDRNGFQFQYVNEISSCLGLSLRHFWNAEKATNRALEEVQETRQTQKGPGMFIRSEQRNINNSGCLRQFGPRTRMGFIEEVDLASQETNAKVLKLYSEALAQFAQVFGGEVNGEAFLAWLQGANMLPVDLELITNLGVMENPEQFDTPDGETTLGDGEPEPTPISSGEKGFALDYDEITMDGDGRLLEKRRKVISIHKIMERQYQSEMFTSKELEDHTPKSFVEILTKGRDDNLKKFMDVSDALKSNGLSDEEKDRVDEIISNKDSLTDKHHRWIRQILEKETV